MKAETRNEKTTVAQVSDDKVHRAMAVQEIHIVW